MKKYKINFTDLDTRHGIYKLEGDGFTRETIMKSMYKHTDGMKTEERTRFVEKLFDRIK